MQKVYLGVGKVLTSDEAREIVNRETDAGLTVPGPEFSSSEPAPRQSQNAEAMAAHLRHLLGIEQKQVQKFLDRGDTIEHIDGWYEKWIDRLTAAISNYGGDYQIAQNHCVRSLAYLKRKPETFDLAGSEELIIKEIQDNA